MGSSIQSGTSAAGSAFNRFVEGDERSNSNRNVDPDKRDFWDSFGAPPKGPSEDKKDFWDEFGAAPKGPSKDKQDFWDEFSSAGDARTQSKSLGTAAAKKPSGIGTSAMKKSGGGGGGKKEEEGWGDW